MAVLEHVAHISHFGGVETAQVKVRQFYTATKHIIHIGDLAGVQVAHAREGFKFGHGKEPIVGGGRAGISERGVKDHLGHIGFGAVSVPAGP